MLHVVWVGGTNFLTFQACFFEGRVDVTQPEGGGRMTVYEVLKVAVKIARLIYDIVKNRKLHKNRKVSKRKRNIKK